MVTLHVLMLYAHARAHTLHKGRWYPSRHFQLGMREGEDISHKASSPRRHAQSLALSSLHRLQTFVFTSWFHPPEYSSLLHLPKLGYVSKSKDSCFLTYEYASKALFLNIGRNNASEPLLLTNEETFVPVDIKIVECTVYSKGIVCIYSHCEA